jgi:hypothetical protein
LTLLIDAAPLVALADPDEPRRGAILDALEGETGGLVVPVPQLPRSTNHDLNLGLADWALSALAGRYETTRLLTFDERHFRAVTPLRGDAFNLLPADG